MGFEVQHTMIHKKKILFYKMHTTTICDTFITTCIQIA